MKKALTITVLVVAVYFLALPVLFTLHIQHHESSTSCHHADHYTVSIIDDADCGFCDLYQTQHVAIERVFSFSLATEGYVLIEQKVGHLVIRSIKTQFLRGPPMA